MAVAAEDIPEVATALAEFVAAPEPYLIGSDPPLDLRALAGELRLLPALLDWGGYYGVRPCGAVASVAWDEPHAVRAEADERVRNMVYHHAALKYPALAALVPRRPADAVVCEGCGGSGRCSGLPAELATRVVCLCGGLGWVPAQTPNQALQQTPPHDGFLGWLRSLVRRCC